MRQLSARKKRVSSLLGAGALLIGGVAAPALLAAGPASAATCVAGAPCTITGTATLGTGTLTLTAPASLTWAGTLTGLTQDFADTATTDETYNVTDATGGTTGWNVSVAATNFTDATAAALPSTGTFFTNGSVTVPTDTTPPTAACTSGAGTCTLPTNAITYPVDVVTTALDATPLPSVIYEASGGTGLGSIDIGGSTAANPVGWWITTRPDTAPGTYTSTITLTLATGP
jgi:fibronectin-binding autotransporter adhesin